MLKEPFHLSDQDIVLVLDGEGSRRRAKRARAHLTACWACRSRLSELEGTIENFVSLHHRAFDPPPSSGGSLALLKARLGQAAAARSEAAWPRLLQRMTPHRTLAYLCLAVFVTILGAKLLLRNARSHQPTANAALFATAPVPDHTLTPGMTRPVSIGDVCAMPHEEVVRDVPRSLQQEVFKEYGIVNPRPGDYEIDYLIAPGLGGAEDIHNLWPEPSTASAWNAHVKDALEERLHQLVCDGKLDLPTAQQAIATDWITAYKKYFGSNRYVSQANPYTL